MAQQINVTLGYEVKTDSTDEQSGKVTIVDTTSVTARVGGVRSVAPAANVQIPFDGATTSKLLIIRADGAFNVRFGGAAVDPVPVRPVAAGQPALIAVSAETTSIYVENPGTASISVTLLLGAI